LAFIYARARNRYRDTPVLGKDIGAKVRKLIDDHVVSMGIDPKIPPVSLTDADFQTHMAREPSDRAKASEMEHMIRAHIREHMDQDPVAYRKLSERLRELLDQLGQQWEELAKALNVLAENIRAGHLAPDEPVPEVPERYAPFMRLLSDAVYGHRPLTSGERQRVIDLAVEVVDAIASELTRTFWQPSKQPARDAVASRVFALLMKASLPVTPQQIDALVDRLMELARANHRRLVET
jgi:type I restriction enzyme R subunit